MAKPKTQFVCTECGSAQMKWMGRCPDCGEWNTLQEVRIAAPAKGASSSRLSSTMPKTIQALSDVEQDGGQRLQLSNIELNRVLGGGIVPGSAVLIGGDPGIGKSTLLLQMAADLTAHGGRVLYVSAEESVQQIGQRAKRLELPIDNLFVLSDIVVEQIIEQIEQMRPSLVVIDSIQAVHTEMNASAAGSVSQVRDSAALLLRVAKENNIPLFLVGHVTKDGAIAGPRVLEHMVDVVLQLDGERFHAYRLLHSVKNRYGSTNEVGIFSMGERGMTEVRNPSQLFLAERLPNAAGSAIAVTMEGTRPLLVEVQALSSHTPFSQPRRTANGVDFNRMLLLTAVLTKRVGVNLSDQDIFINVIGGLQVGEPAGDLAIAAAIASSYRNRPVHADIVAIGEVGLSGELRSVGQLERRLREAEELGFRRALVPRSAIQQSDTRLAIPNLEILPAQTLREAIGYVLAPTPPSATPVQEADAVE